MTLQMYSNQNGVDDETAKNLITWRGEVFSSHALLFKWCLRAAKDFLLLLLFKAGFTWENDNNNVNGAGDDMTMNISMMMMMMMIGLGVEAICGNDINGGENEDDNVKTSNKDKKVEICLGVCVCGKQVICW